MKMLLILLMLMEVILLVLAVSPVFVDRKSAARALVEWRNNPTPENKSTWEREAALSRRERTVTGFFIFALLAANTVGLIVLIRKIRKPFTS